MISVVMEEVVEVDSEVEVGIDIVMVVVEVVVVEEEVNLFQAVEIIAGVMTSVVGEEATDTHHGMIVQVEEEVIIVMIRKEADKIAMVGDLETINLATAIVMMAGGIEMMVEEEEEEVIAAENLSIHTIMLISKVV